MNKWTRDYKKYLKNHEMKNFYQGELDEIERRWKRQNFFHWCFLVLISALVGWGLAKIALLCYN